MLDSLFNNPILAIAVVVVSVILHEIAHGYVADKLGDPTAKITGRLNLNPLNHIDPIMSVLLPLILILGGSPVVFAAAKPVPVDPYNLRNPKKDMGLIAAAGPIVFFLLALLGGLVIRLLSSFSFFPDGFVTFVGAISLMFIQTNLSLFFFNLIPIPPLDGSRILASVLSDENANALMRLEPFGFLIIFFLLMFPLPGFSITGIISKLTYTFFGLLTGIPTVGII